ncbi:hypothetical protein GJ496_009502 [Pomphorhynchus laevis]|nr:hypothetical protein GJ496_009502 [Pomphorhynchus laevis]
MVTKLKCSAADNYPGRLKSDCEEISNSSTNLSKQCLNEQFPDSFNNYRDAEIVQIKHHWWWKEFCKYDDYNWDISLIHIMNKYAKFSSCFPLYGSRIIHIGIIGVHNKVHLNYSIGELNIQIKQRLNVVDEISNQLFPEKLQFKRRSKIYSKNMYGGWSDPRDIALCNLFSEISD